VDASAVGGVSVLAVLAAGLLSFLSPCVVPVLPLYMSYLAGGTRTVAEDGTVSYRRSTVMLNTLLFVVGIGCAFLVLALGFTAAGQLLSSWRDALTRVGGVIIILFGLVQLGVFGSGEVLSQERRLPLDLDRLSMSPIVAFGLGFVFSFAWTPCVGPVLASVLLMAGSSASAVAGIALVGVYTLGFAVPFLVVGLATGKVLGILERHRKALANTVKVTGVILVLIGALMVSGLMGDVTSTLAGATGSTTQSTSEKDGSDAPAVSDKAASQEGASSSTGTSSDLPAAPGFILTDQNGKTHDLAEYRGKVVVVNFWATWCHYCKQEMPDIQALYEDQGANGGDVVVLGMANPKSTDHPHNADVKVEEIRDFLDAGGYTYPVLMDETGNTFSAYGIAAYPTTFVIDRDGNVAGSVRGAVSRARLDGMVAAALASGQ
jgi:cytochrome c-type biogenesis protein